jgi:glycosyltransferase involved in cell wall biosynthesis
MELHPRVREPSPAAVGSIGALTPRVSILIINKDDRGLADTLAALTELAEVNAGEAEVLVVDASQGRLDDIRDRYAASVRWIPYDPIPGRSSIPQQRNVAVAESAGEIIVFTDASCVPEHEWLSRLLAPFGDDGEQIVAGSARSSRGPNLRDNTAGWLEGQRYIREAPTINLAMTREVHAELGGFDESFGYGSDVDFTWRANDAGYRVRYVESAIVRHDWGTPQSDLRRSYTYGKARARLYRKHVRRWPDLFTHDITALGYPVFLAMLPLTVLRRFRWLPLALAIPLVRNRNRNPVATVLDHLVYAAGVLRVLGESLPWGS